MRALSFLVTILFMNSLFALDSTILSEEAEVASIGDSRKPANKTASDKLEESPIKFGVMLDTYYMYNLNSPTGGAQTNVRNYDRNHNDFTLSLLELNFRGSKGDIGYYVDLDFGSFANQNAAHPTDTAAGDGITHNVGQAYLTYNLHSYKISAGKMYTNVGYEVAKAQDNWNYSRSFAFSIGGPFWHEGVSITKSYDSGFGWGLFVYDDWDKRQESNDEKTYSGQIKYSSDSFVIIYNYITGQQNPAGTLDADGQSRASQTKSAHELNTQWDINKDFALALNLVLGSDGNAGGTAGNVKDGEWNAVVGYLHYEVGDFSITPRYEVFSYKNALPTTQNGSSILGSEFSLTGITLTGGYNLNENSELRLEARRDQASKDFYVKDGVLVQDQITVSLSWLWQL